MRIVIIRPCCIGDVVMATATLCALRRAYPAAHITWAVGGWSQQALAYHPDIDALLDTGPAALPVKSARGFLRFVRQLRRGDYDLAVSLVRSPLMSAAVWLSGIPTRAGLDSNGRGFGYNVRAAIDPQRARNEADIYLDTVRALGHDVSDCRANLPVLPNARESVRRVLGQNRVRAPYLVIHPGGGSNPGMTLDAKRYPPAHLAYLANALAEDRGASVVLLAGPHDQPLVDAVQAHLSRPAVAFVGALSFPQIGALAADSLLYIGNDTGLTHLAAASGAKTVMIFGPSDPARYAPFVPPNQALALWCPVDVAAVGVAGQSGTGWDWSRDGIPPEDALSRIRAFLAGAEAT